MHGVMNIMDNYEYGFTKLKIPDNIIPTDETIEALEELVQTVTLGLRQYSEKVRGMDQSTGLVKFEYGGYALSMGYRPSEERIREEIIDAITKHKVVSLQLNRDRDCLVVYYIKTKEERMKYAIQE